MKHEYTKKCSYDSRSELVNANLNGVQHGYDYDNIGNRAAAVEDSSGVASRKEYTANALNQYTAIGDFEPTYDDAGNQTPVKTSTGIRAVEYDALRFLSGKLNISIMKSTY